MPMKKKNLKQIEADSFSVSASVIPEALVLELIFANIHNFRGSDLTFFF